ncbi:MAG: ATP-binding protein [Nitrospirota bacterium]
MAEFYDREREENGLRSILESEPNLVYFVYGPINSGKTSLMVKTLHTLGEEYRIFYMNFRGVEIRYYEDFIRAMFMVREDSVWEKLKKNVDIMSSAIEFVEQIAKTYNDRIELPSTVLRAFFNTDTKENDLFNYLERLFRRLMEKGKRPVLVLDELQMVKEVKKNEYVIHDSSTLW